MVPTSIELSAAIPVHDEEFFARNKKHDDMLNEAVMALDLESFTETEVLSALKEQYPSDWPVEGKPVTFASVVTTLLRLRKHGRLELDSTTGRFSKVKLKGLWQNV